MENSNNVKGTRQPMVSIDAATHRRRRGPSPWWKGSGILLFSVGQAGSDANPRPAKDLLAMHHVTATTRRIRDGEVHDVDYLSSARWRRRMGAVVNS